MGIYPAELTFLRRVFSQKNVQPTTRPWGDIVEMTDVARGIAWFRTAARSGYHLSPARQKAMPWYLRTEDRYYEGVTEWAGVAVVFDRVFDKLPAGEDLPGESLYQRGRETLKELASREIRGMVPGDPRRL